MHSTAESLSLKTTLKTYNQAVGVPNFHKSWGHLGKIILAKKIITMVDLLFANEKFCHAVIVYCLA